MYPATELPMRIRPRSVAVLFPLFLSVSSTGGRRQEEEGGEKSKNGQRNIGENKKSRPSLRNSRKYEQAHRIWVRCLKADWFRWRNLSVKYVEKKHVRVESMVLVGPSC